MKVLERKIRALDPKNNDHLSLPSVRPQQILAAKRKALGRQAWQRNIKAANTKLPPILSTPRRNVADMTHGVVSHYRQMEDMGVSKPLPPAEPIMTKCVYRNGKRIDKQEWFSHPA